MLSIQVVALPLISQRCPGLHNVAVQVTALSVAASVPVPLSVLASKRRMGAVT